jgi:hypothetical protein
MAFAPVQLSTASYARRRITRFGVEWLMLTGIVVAFVAIFLTPQRFPGPAMPFRGEADIERWREQRSAWVQDFNANGYDARFLPHGELAMLGGQFHIPPADLEEAVAAADLVVLGSVQSITYMGDGFAYYTLAVDEYLKGEGSRLIEFQGEPAIVPERQPDGSLVSGRGQAVGPEVFEGDRIVMLFRGVALMDGGVLYFNARYGSFLKLSLGRVVAPDFSFPDQLNGLTMEELLSRIRAAAAAD